jgi:2,3-bisphosphoglycerate-dependent phosphoglycerate mutase
MKNSRILMCCLMLLGVLTTFSVQGQTTIWIVRHAEKDTKNPTDPDPSLTVIGQERAKDLADLLSSKKVLAVYSTPYKRTTQTVEPVAKAHNVTVQTYNPANAAALAALVLQQYKDGSVVIVGHSNTVLELVEAFGAKRPVPALGEDDYDYVFTVTVQGNSVHLQTAQYGKAHRGNIQK